MEEFDLENFPTSESAKQMLGYVSADFYERSYIGKWLFQVMGLEYDNARKVLEDLPNQFFPETATWGLKYHEIKWGLPIRENLPYEDRRRLIYQKRDSKAPMTPYAMEEYLSNFTNFEIHISDVHDTNHYGYSSMHPNLFSAVFIGEGNFPAKVVLDALNKIKQSHTEFIASEYINHFFQLPILYAESLHLLMEIYRKNYPLFCDERDIEATMTAGGNVDLNMELDAGLLVEKDLWFLDGSVSLEGSRILDAEVYTVDIS